MKKLVLFLFVALIAAGIAFSWDAVVVTSLWLLTGILANVFVYQHQAVFENQKLGVAVLRGLTLPWGKLCSVLSILFSPIFALIVVGTPLRTRPTR